MPRRRSSPQVVAQRGELIVERDPDRPSGRLLRQSGMHASYVDLADPTHLEFDYLRWIRIVLRTARARRVLHLGGGACTLARALAAADPDGRQDVCELDPEVLAVARTHLGLQRAPGLQVHQADGRAYLARLPDSSFDAVVIDAYIGAAIPRSLVTVQALGGAARIAPLTVVNVVDNRTRGVLGAVAAGLAASHRHVWGLGGRGSNVVAVGAEAALELDRIAALAAADPSPARLIDPPRMARMSRSAAELHDPDTEPPRYHRLPGDAQG